ncbi:MULTISPECIES: hypothetical protein [unclassified Lentimicrobium]|uniref:hypothetical protein n=1 Tax=unclassified Lentimicrobium TaxID=2677434 RepID=UPI001557BD51|nr:MULTISPECIES: hypothetical protein [unclassified Lentimicrobium]NPD45279.1 hypothetical protein [Lentimicrobium sp. S6]NPD86502.1 hypothetical protein [Lentimicrobium sp. L6]
MNISLFLAQYLQFRLKSAKELELYLVDQVNSASYDIIIKDSGDKIEDKTLEESEKIIKVLNLQNPHKNHIYYHKGYNNLNMELKLDSGLIPDLGNFHSLLAMIILDHPHCNIVFSYMSPRGEYVLNSDAIHQNFSKEELQSKELLTYINELLKGHFDDIIFTKP